MEQSRLGLHDMLHQEHQSLHDQHFNSSANLRAPKISLRSMSKSDPHLNIPHLMMSQDEDHPSLNKIVSGLFHADTVLSAAPHLHSAPMSAGHSNNALKPCESSATLLREPSDNTPSLRKSSSAVSWTFADKGQELFPWSPSDNSVKSSTTAFLPGLALNQVSEHHHHTQGGLVMSSTTTDSKMSVLVPAAPNHAAFSPSLASAASSSMSVPAINPLEPQVASHDRKNYGMFGNMFRQGFFSRPVVRSDEENYRYIMALDR